MVVDQKLAAQLKTISASLKPRPTVSSIIEQMRSGITKLDLTKESSEQADLEDEAISSISDNLKTNETLQHLALALNHLGVKAARSLSDAIKANRALKSLDLGYNCEIADEGIEVISAALAVNRSLESLNLSTVSLGLKGMTALSRALIENQSLKVLDLRGNPIHVVGARVLGEALKDKTTVLEHLDLGNSAICSEGTRFICDALCANPIVLSLGLGFSHLKPDAAHSLMRVLSSPKCSLQILNLDSNKELGVEGASYLAIALKANQSLYDLSLCYCELGDEATKSMADALSTNKGLKYFAFQGNKLSDEGTKALCNALINNNTLKELDLYDNNITNEGAKAIIEMLKTNKTLTKIELGKNKIDDTLMAQINSSLRFNRQLQSLGVYFPRGGKDGKECVEAGSVAVSTGTMPAGTPSAGTIASAPDAISQTFTPAANAIAVAKALDASPTPTPAASSPTTQKA